MSLLKGLEQIGLAAVDTVMVPVDGVVDAATKNRDKRAQRRAKRVARRLGNGLKEIYQNDDLLEEKKDVPYSLRDDVNID